MYHAKTTQVQVLSDIHLEMRGRPAVFDFPTTAPYLALCGDIGDPGDASYREFMLLQSSRYDKVFIVAGNHSYYGRSVDDTHALINSVCAEAPAKLVYLNMTRHDLDGDYVVLGCTLWSLVPDDERKDVAYFIADYRRIKDWSVETNNWMHARHVAWLRSQLAQVKQEGRVAVVLTHHAPTRRNTSAIKNEGNPLSSAFATDLEHLIRLPVVLWAYGHTHFSNDQHINGVRVVSNQVGYSGEDVCYDPGFRVELEVLDVTKALV